MASTRKESTSYGVPEKEASFWRSKVDARIIRMTHLTDVTERQAVRELWHTAQVFDTPKDISPERIDQALKLVETSHTSVPLLVKTFSIVRLCQMEPYLSESDRVSVRQRLHDAIATEPDDVDFFILTGSWIAGLGINNLNDFYETTKLLDTQIDATHAVSRLGIQRAMAKMSELVQQNRLHLDVLTVIIKGREDDQEHRSKEVLGYPDTIMILPQGSKPSKRKFDEAAAIGVPELSAYLNKRTLMAMIGVESQAQERQSAGNVHVYHARKWSFVSLGSLRIPGSERYPTGPILPDGLTLWLAVEVADDMRRIKGSDTTVDPQYLEAKIRRELEKLSESIGVIDVATNLPRTTPGTLDMAYRELSARIVTASQHQLGDIKERLVSSVYELVVAAGIGEHATTIPDRDTILATFIDAAWNHLPEEDIWAFAKILLHPGSRLWFHGSIQNAQDILVDKFERGSDIVIPVPIKQEVFSLVKRQLRLKWETIKDKEAVNALIWFGLQDEPGR